MTDPKPTGSLIRPALFGAIDGLGLAIGILLVLHGKAGAVIAAAAAANAASELAGMASGQYLSTRGEAARVPRALSNGLASAIGAFVPVLAFVLLGWAGALVVLGMFVLVIASALPSVPWWRSWVETGITVGTVAAVCWVVAVLV